MKSIDAPGPLNKTLQLDWEGLLDYLENYFAGISENTEIMQFHGGHANLSFLIKNENYEFIMRRPPFGKIAPGAHDMKREFRVLSKLHPFYAKAPKAYHLCTDKSIIGADFILMERKKGIVVRYAIPDAFMAMDKIGIRISKALVNAQAELHMIDIEHAGLEELGKPEGFLNRQLMGWQKRIELSQATNKKQMKHIKDQLVESVPQTRYHSVIHNDFKFDNCQFQPTDPDSVSAVLDWDMATLGDPLFDFASSLVYWPDEFFKDRNIPPLLKGEFPHKDLLLDQYFAETGFGHDKFEWYEAIAYWKTAIIAQQLLDRYLMQNKVDPKLEKFKTLTPAFADKAEDLCKRL